LPFEVLAVSRVLISPTISDLRNFEPERDRQKKSQNQVDTYLEDLAILFKGGFKTGLGGGQSIPFTPGGHLLTLT